MKKTVGASVFPLMLIAASCAQAQDGWGDKLSKMVTDGKASLDFRYRYEFVDQEGFDKDAKASTLRSRLTLASAKLNGFSVLMEADDLRSVGSDDYNSTENGNTQYPVVADPEGTDLNQAWIRYSAENGDGTLGRQRILHGNQRFIGGVAWRQNEQTYDGVRAKAKFMDKLDVDLSYVYQVNRIFGPNDGANPAKLEGDNVFLRADFEVAKGHKISGFGYWLDFDPQAAYAPGKTVNNSSDTYGLEYSGKFDWLSLAASWATQEDAGSSQKSYEADYYMVEAGVSFKPVNAKIGYEVLGSDNNTGFATPLATLHKFQGWADQFLATPGDGVEDAYVSVGGKLGPVKLAAVYHDFQAESASEDYGTEIDLVATWPINKQFTVQAKYADFDADSSAFRDVKKAWMTLQLKL
jgi:hypothetical protein